MWEMQLLGRRAGALDVVLISQRLGEMTVVPQGQTLDPNRHDGQYSRAALSRLPYLTAFDWKSEGDKSLLQILIGVPHWTRSGCRPVIASWVWISRLGEMTVLPS